MTTDVKVPASGESVTSANVARWHKKNGDSVRKGEVLVTLETDKVSNELEAADDGVLEILVGEGEEVAIGTLIARIPAKLCGGCPSTRGPHRPRCPHHRCRVPASNSKSPPPGIDHLRQRRLMAQE